MSVFDSYKPFRNSVAVLAIEDALRVIWAYSQYLQFNDFRFPSDIQVDPQFLNLRPPQQWISEWHLETLAKEIILNGQNYADRRRTLRSWPVLAGVLNKLKDFENDIPIPPANPTLPLIMLNRISHQQFIWQTNRPSSRVSIRHYKIYNTPVINQICLDRLRTSVFDLYLCGMAFLGTSMHAPATTYPMSSEIRGLSISKIDAFLAFACRTVAELTPLIKSEQLYDSAFFYAYNPLRAYPLIRIQNPTGPVIVSPLPTLVFWRFTGGLYYDLVDDPRFSNEFGKSFQNYVGESIERACPDGRIRLFPEESFGSKKQRKDTVDWIASDKDSALFLECKAKRLSWGAKIALDDLGPLRRDIDTMADAVVQLYKTIRDYHDGRYPHFAFDLQRKVYPVIVTLEHWHLFGPAMRNILHRSICAKLEAVGIPLKTLDEMPFSVWHVGELERGMQIVNDVGIQTFMDGKLNDREMREWGWDSYMTERFRGRHENRQLFGEEYEKMFSEIGL